MAVGVVLFARGIVLSSGYLWEQCQLQGWNRTAKATPALTLMVIITICVGWTALHTGRKRGAGFLQRVLAAAGARSRSQSCRRPLAQLVYQSFSVVGMAGVYRGRELLLPKNPGHILVSGDT